MIKGITVTLYERKTPTPEHEGDTVQTKDGFNRPIWAEVPVDVPNVLVTPSSATDIVSDIQLYGRKSEYELCIPKGDTHDWENSRVEFFGQQWHTFTPIQEWIEANVPLKWNRKIKVERYE